MASKIKKRKKIIKKPAQPSRQSGLKSFTSRASAKGAKRASSSSLSSLLLRKSSVEEERLLSLPERHSEGAEMKANPEGGKLHRLPERHSEGAEMKANPEGGKLHRLPERVKKTRIRVIGIGGGGGSIVSELAERIKRASFVAANTDLQALKSCNKKVSIFQFGQDLTFGLGTGMNIELAREAAEKEKDKIKKLFQGQDLVILISCLGGGAGSGGAPVFAKICRSLGILTFGIFTLPFEFEGEKKKEIALDCLKKTKNSLNTLAVIPNDRVFQMIDKTFPLKESFSVINKKLAEGLEGLIETIFEPGLINIDFADLKTIFQEQGKLTYLNTISVPQKENLIEELMVNLLNCPLYPYNIEGSRGVLFNIAGQKDLSLTQVNQISKTIFDLVNPQARIIFGISQNKKDQNFIKITILAIGCGLKNFSLKLKEKIKEDKPSFPSVLDDKKMRPKKKIKAPLNPRMIMKGKEKSLPCSPPSLPSEDRLKKEPRKELKTKIEKKALKESNLSSRAEPDDRKGEETSSLLPPRFAREKEKAPQKTPLKGIISNLIRKNGLQIKKETEELEKEILEKEKIWEKPAFLRKKFLKP